MSYVIVGLPHRGAPIIGKVLNTEEEVIDQLLDNWVDDDYDQTNRDFDDVLDRAGRDYNRLEVMTKDEVIDRIVSRNTQGHLGIELLTELEKLADNEGWNP